MLKFSQLSIRVICILADLREALIPTGVHKRISSAFAFLFYSLLLLLCLGTYVLGEQPDSHGPPHQEDFFSRY